jgi:phenylpropionate dioxygenase-like ring-hydroxylating dioxygenase large terminal subunit
MIRDQWYVILFSREVKRNRVVGVKRLGVNIVVWRDGKGKLGAALDKCPHRGIQLSKGKMKEDNLQCPFHGFEYDASGRCRIIPANGKAAKVPDHIRLDSYPVSEANGFIYLFWKSKEKPAAPPDELPWFIDLEGNFAVSEFTDPWKAHYSRVIENQLDVVHLPFIHKTTIGRGIGPLVNGPYTEVSGTSLSFWPGNEQDNGQTPVLPKDMKKPERKSTYLTFLFPNLWQNHIMDAMRIVVAFVPVDESNTILYLRTYQKMVRIPVLKELFFWLSRIYNKIILGQDRRVVETHQPMETHLRMEENLIPGDHPVILYRKIRDELKRDY